MAWTRWIPFIESKEIKLEETELELILLEFFRFKLIDKALKSAKKIRDYEKNLEKAKRMIKKAFRLLRREERVERRLESGFERMKEAVGKRLETIKTKHSNKFRDVKGKFKELENDLKKAEVFNADLLKEAARGGEIEKSIESSEESLSKLNLTIKEVENVMIELKGFEVEIKKIQDETETINNEIEGDMNDEEKWKEKLKKRERLENFNTSFKALIDSVYGKIRDLEGNIRLIRLDQEEKQESLQRELNSMDPYKLDFFQEEKRESLSEEFDQVGTNVKNAEKYSNTLNHWTPFFVHIRKFGLPWHKKNFENLEINIKELEKDTQMVKDNQALFPRDGNVVLFCNEILEYLSQIEDLISKFKKKWFFT